MNSLALINNSEPRGRVLIVDDSRCVRHFLKRQLQDYGFTEVVEAGCGLEAFQKLDEYTRAQMPFDLIISDCNMPEMSGIELLRHVRKSPMTRSLPFLLLTTDNQKSHILNALNFGVSNYILKPCSRQVLFTKLQNYFEPISGEIRP